jgi:nucleotide sugar dehydrogenase
MRIDKIAIIGLGYVGLPTAIAFVKAGFSVYGVDIDKTKINKLLNGKSTITEVIKNSEIARAIRSKKFLPTTDVTNAVKESDVIVITVPTPVDNAKNPDLRYVKSAAKSIAKGFGKNKLVVLESTVYPGVTEEIVQPILEQTKLVSGRDFGLAYCPERYNPGDKHHKLETMPRIVGAINKKWLKITVNLYKKITKADVLAVSNIKTAEAAKVIENIQRDLNIALMNELALIFDKIGINVREVIDAAATKWNFHKYEPGPGCGGHCIPVDPYYLVYKAKQIGYRPKIITAGRQVNDYMAQHVVNLTVRALNKKDKKIKNAKIAILGVAYKANVADIRESPAIRIISALKSMNARVYAYDPYVEEGDIKKTGAVPASLENALKNADCVILHTDHGKFKKLKLKDIVKPMQTKAVVDCRGLFKQKPDDVVVESI